MCEREGERDRQTDGRQPETNSHVFVQRFQLRWDDGVLEMCQAGGRVVQFGGEGAIGQCHLLSGQEGSLRGFQVGCYTATAAMAAEGT